ncbi:unnamed protein product [Caenorhabditis sp. 36 PRJEB53466]|nr:unnamed protein product [Caenorhabditis sp. 36 PRJEB53466]CAI2355691.1 unnamed protein product [Caenorhabditis sp. 36 PRJEB53466]
MPSAPKPFKSSLTDAQWFRLRATINRHNPNGIMAPLRNVNHVRRDLYEKAVRAWDRAVEEDERRWKEYQEALNPPLRRSTRPSIPPIRFQAGSSQ